MEVPGIVMSVSLRAALTHSRCTLFWQHQTESIGQQQKWTRGPVLLQSPSMVANIIPGNQLCGKECSLIRYNKPTARNCCSILMSDVVQVGNCCLACVAVHMSIGNLHSTNKRCTLLCLFVCLFVSTSRSSCSGQAPALTVKAKLTKENGLAKLTGTLITQS